MVSMSVRKGDAMYLENTVSGYDRNGEQVARRARFLILMQVDGSEEIRGIVRKVALRQMGHWMMGRARIGQKWYTLSGAYGADGLVKTVAQDAFDRGTPLPEDLREKWNTGGGWNDAGSEAPEMRKWGRALPSFKE